MGDISDLVQSRIDNMFDSSLGESSNGSHDLLLLVLLGIFPIVSVGKISRPDCKSGYKHIPERSNILTVGIDVSAVCALKGRLV